MAASDARSRMGYRIGWLKAEARYAKEHPEYDEEREPTKPKLRAVDAEEPRIESKQEQIS